MKGLAENNLNIFNLNFFTSEKHSTAISPCVKYTVHGRVYDDDEILILHMQNMQNMFLCLHICYQYQVLGFSTRKQRTVYYEISNLKLPFILTHLISNNWAR